jgi:2-polyprenyl-3-methyl-5-hydroxy-6-metoxy-1,4-benzoquinol methylase
MKKNTNQLWDNLWEKNTSAKEDIFNLAKEENCIRWIRLEKIVLDNFGSFKDLKVIEIGAGAGTNAALMAKKGAKVTVLDYSDNALKASCMFFDRNGLSAEFIKLNALSLPLELLNKYDISMSFGLSEHFIGLDRININKAHFDVLKKGGLAFISVPNKNNPPYRIFKFIAEHIGQWNVGEEYPYTRKEFTEICKQVGVSDYSFFGDSLWRSLNFISPIKIFRKIFKIKNKLNINTIKKEKGTPLDEYLSYAIVLCGKK